MIFAINKTYENMISRQLESQIRSKLFKGKAIILLGARQTGKTTLLQSLLGNDPQMLWLNADEPDVIALFENANSSRLKKYFGSHSIVIIDEAQRISDIGIKLKLITDQIKNIQLIATGSSAFELANQINEPLTGRKWEYQLFPLSYAEMVSYHGMLEENRLLPHRLIYGYYPDVVNSRGNEKEILKQLTDSYLYKDILMWEQIKKPEKLMKLLQALAFQLGSEVSYNELGKLIGLDNQTVEKYVQLLEQVFIIFRLPAFSRNLRKELKKGRKIYFYDNGIRNAILASFGAIELRSDIGALWENFLLAERQKHIGYSQIWNRSYFWRTHDQQEIDYIEELDGELFAYEFKWNPAKKAKVATAFETAYPGHKFRVINRDNFDEFIL